MEEIKAVSTSLLKQHLPKFQAILSKDTKEITFKLEVKRRLCSHLTRDEIIQAVTPSIYGGLDELPGYTFKVNLSDPDFSIRIDTCKSLCGITILQREGWYKNFNLSELNLTQSVHDSKTSKAVGINPYKPSPDDRKPAKAIAAESLDITINRI